MSFFLFPFFFLVPLFLTVFAVRAGSSFFRTLSQRDQRREFEGFFPPNVHPWARGSSQEARIFQLANKLKGRVTISDVVIETGMGVQEAEELMQRLVDNTRVRMEVDDRGLVTYEFPEIFARYER
jgi:hypothetical protein